MAKPTITIVNATEAQNRFGEMIRRAYMDEEHLIVKRGGIPVVAIVPMSDYQRLIGDQQIPDNVTQVVASGTNQEVARRQFLEYLERAHHETPAVPEEEAERDIQDAVRAVRADQ